MPYESRYAILQLKLYWNLFQPEMVRAFWLPAFESQVSRMRSPDEVVAHALRRADRQICVSPRPVWSTDQVSRQPGFHRETVFKKQTNKLTKKKGERYGLRNTVEDWQVCTRLERGVVPESQSYSPTWAMQCHLGLQGSVYRA